MVQDPPTHFSFARSSSSSRREKRKRRRKKMRVRKRRKLRSLVPGNIPLGKARSHYPHVQNET